MQYGSRVPAVIPDDQQYFYNVSHGLMVLRNVDIICHQRSEYVGRVYKDAIIAFDSYESLNTKYMIHQRHSKR